MQRIQPHLRRRSQSRIRIIEVVLVVAEVGRDRDRVDRVAELGASRKSGKSA